MDKLEGIKPGDRVRVTFEADVVDTDDGGLHLSRDNVAADKAWFGPRACSAATFQIERIEPPLSVGDRVKIKDGGSGEILALHGDEAWMRADEVKYTSIWNLSDLERIA